MDYKMGLYGKKPATSTWDKVVKTRSKFVLMYRFINE
jgi:hypothetical protein